MIKNMYDLLFKNFAKYIDLEESEKELIITAFRFKKYRRKQFLLQEGDICKNQFFLLKGAVRLYQVSNEGKESVIQFAFEDWFIADLVSYFTETPSDYAIDALEDSEVLLLEKATLEELYLKIPKLERFFRIVFQNALITSQWRHTMMQKSAEERYSAFQKRFPFVEQRVSQQNIASYLGITRETLSRLRSQS
jgi:CRP-like cAMP-binding protein